MVAGVIGPALTGGLRAGTITATVVPLGTLSGALATPAIAGALTPTGPLTIRSRTTDARRAGTFLDDYYNRVHLIPTVVDFGSVSGESARSVNLWNAYLTSVNLTGITTTDNTGLSASAGVLPVTIGPLSVRAVTITADADGPPTISTRYSFAFNTADAPRLTVTGQRARLWPFAPNWRDSVEITRSYKTDITTARSSREQRRSLRKSPRRRLSIPVTAHADRMRQFMRSLQTWQNQTVLIADPIRWAGIAGSLAASSSEITLASFPAPDWITAGTNVVFETPTRSEVRTVLSVADAAVIFTEETPYSWPVNTKLRPVLAGTFDAEIQTTNPTSRTVEAVINFDVDPGSEVAPDTDAGLRVHGGREVFTKRPNWAETPATGMNWPVERVDFGHGRVRTFRPVDFGTMLRQATYVGIGAEDAGSIESFFDRQRGKRGEFYMATGLEDLLVRGAITEGTTALRVQGVEVHDTYRGDPVYKAVALRLYDGRTIFRSIVDMFVVSDGLGDDTVLELNTEWLSTIEPSDVAMLSWMPVFRFASDDLTMEWLTGEVAQTQITTQTLEDLTAEGNVPVYDGDANWLLEVWGEAGLFPLVNLNWMVNVRYPAVFFNPLAWIMVHESEADDFDSLVNIEIPEAVL